MTYKIQIDDEIRDSTSDETEVLNKRVAQVDEVQAVAEKAKAKAAIAERLGLTDAELAVLLG